VEVARPVTHAGGNNGNHKAVISPAQQRPPADLQYQALIKNFETGVRAFQKQNYAKAAEIFGKLASSDARDVAERAHLHLRMCQQRTGRPGTAPAPKSADDHYALGIACFNARNFVQALEHLSKADRIKPNQEHVRYALAASHASAGNVDVAIVHLEAAVALRPDNRIHARRDEDLQGLSADPRFLRLIYPTGS
jgi:tetratricopeptide (TPR) repeat protein